MVTASNTENLPARLDRLSHGLRGHLNRFSHVVINVSDLDRAVEFYENTFPVRRRQRINGPAQRYAGLGIERGQFEGWVLENKKDLSPPGDLLAEFPARLMHLVQWKSPGPIGAPYREANHVGIYRQNSLVSNLNEAYTRVQAHGGRPYGEPSWIILTPDGFGVTVFAYRDPDGNTLEMIGAEDPAGKIIYPGMMHHCNLNVRILERSYRFYRDALGLDLQAYLAPAELQPASNGSLGDALRNPDGSEYRGQMQFAATLLGVRSDSRSPIDVLEWIAPKPYGEPYQVANHLGIMRVAFEVDDIVAARARLVATGHTPVGPIETWDMGEFGARKVVIFRDPDGIMLELIEQLSYIGERPAFD
ncbi:MAG: VOC family protein [Gammaproteobacteria bacterium]|nr:VOC family protein [Gammaproteobacteria bacterium]